MAQSNGATSFTYQVTVGGFTMFHITTVSNAQGGTDSQSITQLDLMHLYNIHAQDRAVTVKDYETLHKQFYPNA